MFSSNYSNTGYLFAHTLIQNSLIPAIVKYMIIIQVLDTMIVTIAIA